VDNRRTEFLEVPQVAAFMAAAQASTQVVGSRMLMLMALTGARLGEARALQWCHLDLEAGTWFLPTQKSGRPGVIHLSEPAKAVIRELLPYRRNDYVFPGERDNDKLARPIRLFKKLCQQAGIPEGYRIHDLRHAWCSAGVYAGIPLEVISQGAPSFVAGCHADLRPRPYRVVGRRPGDDRRAVHARAAVTFVTLVGKERPVPPAC
jgi:integrase